MMTTAGMTTFVIIANQGSRIPAVAMEVDIPAELSSDNSFMKQGPELYLICRQSTDSSEKNLISLVLLLKVSYYGSSTSQIF